MDPKKRPARTDILLIILMIIYCILVPVSSGIAKVDTVAMIKEHEADGISSHPNVIRLISREYDFYRNVLIVPGIIGLGLAVFRLRRHDKSD